jgi:valine--pyruvate aminotransferase
MRFRLSDFGERFTRPTGALELMDDLGQAASGDRGALMLGGGNPGAVPEVRALLRRRLHEIAASDAELERMLEKYAHPTGDLAFRRSLAALLEREHGWAVTADNIALTGGSQAAFFLLFNLLAGESREGERRRILLPLTPEYVGYADLGLADDFFVASRPAIEELPDSLFKYHPDFASLELGADVGAICVSRPTNPTGNVLTDAEVERLDGLARANGVPLIVDGAYGPPFPNIVFGDAAPLWNDNVILCLSLSKLGLPAARTGIVVAEESFVEALTRMTAVMSLAVGSVGPAIVQPALDSGEVVALSRSAIQPFYRAKAYRAVDRLRSALTGLPFRIHKPEGAFFLWLWFPGLPISSAELYRRLKAAGVFVLSGHYFFPGLIDPWRHRHECVRVSYAADDDVVARGIDILAREVRAAYEA